MADVNFFDAFGYKWALVGPAEILQDDQYKVGWGFIGAVPPSVEQFNRVHQVADEKANYLFGLLSSIATAAGTPLTNVSVNTLRDALRGTGFFLTAAAGTSDTSPATTAFVQTATSQARVESARFVTSGSVVVPAGKIRALIWATATGGAGGGGGGGGVGSFVGGGGGGGACGQNVIAQEVVVVPGQTITVTIPAASTGGTGGSGVGGPGSAGGNLTITNVDGGTLTLLGGNPGGGGLNATNQAAGGAGGLPSNTSQGTGGYGSDAVNNGGGGDGGAGASGPYGSGAPGAPGRANGGFSAQAGGGYGAGGGGGGGLYQGTTGAGVGGNGSAGRQGFAYILFK